MIRQWKVTCMELERYFAEIEILYMGCTLPCVNPRSPDANGALIKMRCAVVCRVVHRAY